MDDFKDELLNVPVAFDQKSLGKRSQELGLIYHLSKQYALTAHDVASEIQTESELRQYFTLINQAIRCLRYLKDGGFQLSLEQDFQITCDLAWLLIEETHRLDLAEQYLSSLREKLQNTTWINEKMYTDYLLLCKIPLMKNDGAQSKVIVKNLGKLISSLDSSLWKVLFEYFRLQLIPIKERKVSDYRNIIYVVKPHKQFHFVVMCSFINYCLDSCSHIPDDLWSDFEKLESDIPKLQIWKFLLELLVLIVQDINITDKLSEMKLFFDANKEKLDNPLEPIVLFESISLKLDLPVFGYSDVKNLLLFFQSVSYLPNCYDKRSNFSIKFLPKTAANTEKLIQSLQEKCSLTKLNTIHKFYHTLLELVKFYQACESIILKGTVSDISIGAPYCHLLSAWECHIRGDTESASNIYLKILEEPTQNPEMILISIIHLYALTLAQISECEKGSPDLASLTQKADILLNQLNSLLESSIFNRSTVWKCTKLLLTIMGKFEPFTQNPQASTNTSVLLNELQQYFEGNSLLGPNDSTEGNGTGTNTEAVTDTMTGKEIHVSNTPVKIKKSLLLHIWLNYISGSMLVNELDKKCILSSTCFKLAKQQYLPYLRYLVGIWNLMNNTIAMNSKEVALTRARLNQIVKSICETATVEQQQETEEQI